MRKVLICSLAVVTASLALASSALAAASPQQGDGKIALVVDVPDGGVALVEVRTPNGDKVLRTAAVDHDGTFELGMPAGTYSLLPRQVSAGGVRFVAGAQPQTVQVKAGASSAATVSYVRSKGVQNLKVLKLGTTSVSLDWDAERGEGTSVYRQSGDRPATKQGEGTKVKLADSSSLADTGLTPGGVYTYTIFARPGDGAFGRDDVDPVSITVSLEDSDPKTPTFATSPGTVILKAADFTPYSTTAQQSLILALASGITTPVPGTTVIVPVTPALPGGYLGQVAAISPDGRRVELVMGSMGSAFDLYDMHVADVTALPDSTLDPEGAPAPSSLGGSMQGTALKAGAPEVKCGGVTGGLTVTPSFSSSYSSHADVTVDKYNIKFFPDVPHQVNYDLGYATTLQATVKVKSEVTAFCSFEPRRFYRQISVYPVPIGLEVRTTARVSVVGSGTVENLGGSVTAGFDTSGKLSLTGPHDLDGDLILDPNATEPKFTGEPGLRLKMDGTIAFGPGVGSKDVGVIFGVKGNFTPLEANAAVVTTGGASCVKLEAKTTIGLAASLRAWIPGYSTDYSVTIDQLNGEFPWHGSPYYFPSNCTGASTPTKDVVGKGLTVLSDEVTGNDQQFGKVDGFVPGQSTWVLSTGRINDLVGSPGSFASTGLGGAGDAELTSLAGRTTYDAAAYQVTVVPTGHTLVVRYAFGSEEYPEYVGSQFNDVMAVFVNGQNCALVPGTSTPVAINSVNQNSNSQYYVDNTSGAAGYNTALDGLTKPLECRVPVQPGQPVTVKIATADASDSAYDSAVALLDDGIFSE
jgi:hypothetical protein